MDKEKEKRYQTSKILAEDIKRYLQGDPISARPTGIVTKILKKAKKNKIASISIVGAIVIIAVIIGISVSLANKKQEIEKYRTQAYKEFNIGKYEEVVALCNKLLVLSPQDEEMKSLLKKSQSVIKEIENKIQVEKEAKKKQEEAKGILDRIKIGNPTPDDKIKAAEEALSIDPEYGDAYYEMGLAYKAKSTEGGRSLVPDGTTSGQQSRSGDEHRGLINKAFECFSKAIEKSPTLAYSYFERAKITADIRNNFEGAIPDFNKVIELDPNSHLGYCARGNISYYEKNYDDAITHYRKAIDINPNYAETYCNLGTVYREKGEASEAITNLNRAIELKHDYEEAYNARGLVYYENHQLQLAIDDFSKAIDINPNYAEAYRNRGFAYQQQGDFEKAGRDGAMFLILASTEQIGALTQDLLKQFTKERSEKENTK